MKVLELVVGESKDQPLYPHGFRAYAPRGPGVTSVADYLCEETLQELGTPADAIKIRMPIHNGGTEIDIEG